MLVYLVCAVGGGTLLFCQFLLGLLGGGGDHDDVGSDHDAGGGSDHDAGGADHDSGSDGHHHGTHQGSWFFGVLSLRSLLWSLTFFGLTGMAATENWQMAPLHAFAVAVAAGVASLFAVGYLMQSLHRLKSEGTARIEHAVGLRGTVYLTIPGRKAGAGKVHLNLQNRTVEYLAVTANDQLPTGAKIVVTAIVSPDTVEVAPATESGSSSHA
jgi:hypothetical protein